MKLVSINLQVANIAFMDDLLKQAVPYHVSVTLFLLCLPKHTVVVLRHIFPVAGLILAGYSQWREIDFLP